MRINFDSECFAYLETQDFSRLRFGSGDHFENTVEYVFPLFNSVELKYLPSIIQSAGEADLSFIQGGVELTMSRFNQNYIET
jgi:peptidyl-tRNA hydrolase